VTTSLTAGQARAQLLDPWKVGEWLVEDVDDAGHVCPRRMEVAQATQREG